MVTIELENIQAAVLLLYLESLKEGIIKKPINNVNEMVFLDAESAFNRQVPLADIQDSVIEELDMLHEIYSKKQNN
tara:strand:+ start:1098 stop:1325 length:228 start_codon:yes stop_codon:yes gene_type:complete